MAIDKYAFSQDTAWIEVVEDNTEMVLREFQSKINVALEKVGLKAEGDVVGYMTAENIVDTGRLRNSISHTIDNGEKAVYVGTNVEYALYVHEGTSRMAGRPYLTQPIQQHLGEYGEIVEEELKS